ncbi:tail fiber domain-containing protein [Sphingopyxis sp.]|uniref:tail fiber domain-containing protein n=1 Tax=Sphingopyxis sp. TaxID=1908224 RepID=UPI002EDB12C7
MPTPFFADLVRELCHEGGTGPLMPTSAVPGHRRFADAVPADAQFHYAIAGIARSEEWEVGLGRIDSAGRLVRETVAASSSAGTAVDFTPGLKTLALTVGAGWFAESDAVAASLSSGLDSKQPLSTTHASVPAGAASDLLTVRRGSGWANLSLSSLVFKDGGGVFSVNGPLTCTSGSAAAPSISFSADTNTGIHNPAADAIGLTTGGTERVRIGATGHVGLGTTSPAARLHAASSSTNTALIQGTSARNLWSYADSGGVGWGAGAGGAGVGNYSALLYFLDSLQQIRFYTAGSERLRLTETGQLCPAADNSLSLGTGAARWSVLYAGSGTINTSDAREKTWRGAATDAELRAARRIAAELGFYQWNDAIAAKGADGARYHFGVRAQAVWAIMADEGLVDPTAAEGRPGATPYAFLCWDGWDGGDRFGIRPDQLALFLIAAQERRLAALEAAA